MEIKVMTHVTSIKTVNLGDELRSKDGYLGQDVIYPLIKAVIFLEPVA